jgi:hypothetical protein
MFIVKLERRSGTDPPLHMWLTRISPVLWGERENAVRFHDKGDARRAAAGIRIIGAWTVEPI